MIDDAGFSLSRRGVMLVLSSPSGAGKTTISRAVIAQEADISLSVSVTTRPRRVAEREGIDYHFVDDGVFAMMQARGDFLEHAHVFDYHYGTPKQSVADSLQNGRDILFDVDWQGASQLSLNAPDDVVSIFILPPSIAELERRLRERAQDSPRVVRRRMNRAFDEINRYDTYDYIMVNHDIESSVAAVRAILAAERLKRYRQTGVAAFIENLSRKK